MLKHSKSKQCVDDEYSNDHGRERADPRRDWSCNEIVAMPVPAENTSARTTCNGLKSSEDIFPADSSPSCFIPIVFSGKFPCYDLSAMHQVVQPCWSTPSRYSSLSKLESAQKLFRHESCQTCFQLTCHYSRIEASWLPIHQFVLGRLCHWLIVLRLWAQTEGWIECQNSHIIRQMTVCNTDRIQQKLLPNLPSLLWVATFICAVRSSVLLLSSSTRWSDHPTVHCEI